MAFFSKIGSILKQSVSKQITTQFSASNPSIYQALRCMSSSKLFIGGLPYAVDDTSLREAFSHYGEVIEARVIIDRESNRSRGFGFVTFASTEEASSAIQAMDGQDFHGRTVRVNYATERQPRQFGGGYGGGGGGYGGGGYGGGGGFGGGGYGGGGFGGAGGSPYGGGGYGGGQNYGGGSNGGGAPAGGQYGGGSGDFGSGGANFGEGSAGGFGSGGSVKSYGGNYGVGGGGGGSNSFFGGGGSNVNADTGFPRSGFGEEGSGLPHGGSEQLGNDATNAAKDDTGDFDSGEPLEGNYGDNEPDDYVKRA